MFIHNANELLETPQNTKFDNGIHKCNYKNDQNQAVIITHK